MGRGDGQLRRGALRRTHARWGIAVIGGRAWGPLALGLLVHSCRWSPRSPRRDGWRRDDEFPRVSRGHSQPLFPSGVGAFRVREGPERLAAVIGELRAGETGSAWRAAVGRTTSDGTRGYGDVLAPMERACSSGSTAGLGRARKRPCWPAAPCGHLRPGSARIAARPAPVPGVADLGDDAPEVVGARRRAVTARVTVPGGVRIVTLAGRLCAGDPAGDRDGAFAQHRDLIVERLENEGVTMSSAFRAKRKIRLVEAISRSPIRYALTRHEQGGPFMAETYGRRRPRRGRSATLAPER